ncbi:MAG: aldehyde dehydrogenase [Saprospiraceae bacterium]|nr:aldehyde dehydrogenase [Saprospiraceae bacterium]MDZ4702500.1 aldehyde dehydrogenase [Saprospiraceae bacterium]
MEQQIQNYIGGDWHAAQSGTSLDNYQPATGKVYSRLPDSDARDVELAVEAARKAWPHWSKCGVQERFQTLMRIADLIERDVESFARAESADSGKALSLARTVDIPRAIANFRFFATAILHFSSEAHPMEGEAVNFTLRQPLGIVGCISPWNLPLYLFTWKIAPALATGNCVIAKPSELTPMTAYLLTKVCAEAGLPAGVLNILHGLGGKVGQAIVEHPEIKAISFTGGTATGRSIAQTAAPMFKKLSLELGGKNPVLIFADAPFEEMLNTTVRSSFSNNGQICLCGSRIYIQRPLYERFREAFAERVKALRVGDPEAPETNQGALVSQQHLEKVIGYIRLAQEEGGKILCGGQQITLPGALAGGYYLQPTVIEGLPIGCRTNQEEIFGPVVTIAPFDTEEEALALANGTSYGLAATVWTNDLMRAHRVAEQLHFGIVWINCWMLRDLRTPFGGVRQSGVGREGGLDALRFFTEPKNVCIRYW